MIVRKMTAKDLPSVLQIERESFSDPWSETAFLSLFSSDNYKSYVVENDGQILGYTSVIATFYIFEVLNIAVKKDVRRQGVGTLLMQVIKRDAKEVKTPCIYLEVRRGNEKAINLYLKSGFKFDGERKGYYPDGEDALLMSYNCGE